MSNIDPRDPWLDDLLADAAPVPDRGFSDGVEARIKHAERMRRWVFGSVWIGWLTLAAIFVPIKPITRATDLVESVVRFLQDQVAQVDVVTGAATVDALPLVASNVALIVVLVLSIVVVVSLQVQD